MARIGKCYKYSWNKNDLRLEPQATPEHESDV